MRLIVRSPPKSGLAARSWASPGRAPFLLVPWSNPWQDFWGNLAAVLDPRRPLASTFRDIFPDLFLTPRRRGRSFLASALTHAAVLVLVWNSGALLSFTGRPKAARESREAPRRITWYHFADELPAIRPADSPLSPKPSERGGKRPGPSPRGVTQFREQQIVISSPPQPDNNRQTIYQPDTPNIRIVQDVRLPNIVVWNEVERPLPPVDLVKQPLAKLRMPAELIHKNVELPQDLPNLERRISDLKMAASYKLVPSPALPVEPATPSAGNVPANTEPVPPPPPAVPQGGIGEGAQSAAADRLRRLIALGVDPALPSGPIDAPPGNRAGSFSLGAVGVVGATPGTPYGSLTGLADAGGVGPAAAGEGAAPVGRELGRIRVPGLLVSGGANQPVAGPVVVVPRPAAPSPLRAAGPPPAFDPRALLARSMRPQLPEWGSAQPRVEGFQPGKKIYTVYINMPNLASGSGSWILRFAELGDRVAQGVPEPELAAPVAVLKVDPGYPPDAIREKVQGNVVLRAVIRKDGRVERIEVMHSLDSRLDVRAVQAFERWEFQPATRNGTPVDLEAVVQIPFALPRAF